jgi:uncharacterized repeat protein (TIGR01451 family)
VQSTSVDLALSKSVDNGTPIENDTIVYTISATNNGPDNATGVSISDSLPGGVTFVTYSATQGVYTQATGLWDVGALNNLANATLTITATVDVGTAGTTINNIATVNAVDQTDTNAGNDTANASITVASCASTDTITATGDTWLLSSNPTNNNDASPVLQVRTDTVAPTFRSLIQYNLSSIAPGTTVCSANLLLDELDTNPDMTIFVHRVTTSWSAATATWNSPWATPGGDYFSPAATSFAPNTTGIRSIDITALGQYWVDNPGSNFGLILRSTTVGDNAAVQFESLEGSPDPPRLVVVY